MKKLICILLSIVTVFSLCACGDDTQDNGKKDVGETQKEDTTSETQSTQDEEINVDLSQLSSTMVYSEVYNMMTKPSDYMGKIVRMKGDFAIYQATDENGQPIPDKIYFACIIADATACCSQGLEFVLTGDYKYPDDYPELGSEITVTGEFSVYTEGQYQYCYLINATMEA